MSALTPGKNLRMAIYGLKVERAAATLPATATGNLFQVLNGRVIITGISGEVVTALGATATNLKLNVSNTAAGTNVDICADGAVASLAVGSLLSITGVFATALSILPAGQQPNELTMGAGFIRAVTSATNTGTVRWTVTYIPLDDGASVVAV